jgi:hypothetical protein
MKTPGYSRLFFVCCMGLMITMIHLSQPCLCQHNKNTSIAVLWKGCTPKGEITARFGNPGRIKIIHGKGHVKNGRFAFLTGGEKRLDVPFDECKISPGSTSTLVSVQTRENPFSFFLRDVSSEYPVYIPEYHVIVTASDDPRSFDEITAAIRSRQGRTKLEQIEKNPEESFESAAAVTRNQSCPTWLGISRDVRTFEVYYAREDAPAEYEIIRPRRVAGIRELEELDNDPAEYAFVTGRGQGPVLHAERRLEEGILPILHTTLYDDDISYESVFLVSLEKSPLTKDSNIGTHYLVADHFASGHMFTDDQKMLLEEKLKEDSAREEETVLWVQCSASNNAGVPRYAWFKSVKPGRGWWSGYGWEFDGETGFSSYPDGKVFCISRLNGDPLPDEEMAVLLKPGEQALFEFCIPHAPVTRERAMNLARQSFRDRHRECRQFWMDKLAEAPRITLPEKRIGEMLYAGLLHLDLVAYGNEPEETLAPTIGIYSPIGTESAPIIQYFNSMGQHDLARRSLQYFIDKQHEDGMMQNFGGYMVETGAALWTMGEYYRYTRDREWLTDVQPALLKAADFLLKWRADNMETGREKPGYGMISGKVADPEDAFHQFMLNGYAYLGLSRVAEMLAEVDAGHAKSLAEEADAWKADIRRALFQSMACSPVVPKGDGTWCPTVPPWPEATGPVALFADPGNVYSHGTFTARDVLLGPLYLVFCEVLSPEEEAAVMMLDYHAELFYQHNSAFSQPYYSRHACLQLRRGLVKPFLKTYYTTVSALADRQTYSFWEHLYHASPHKTHEEGWFLMQTRWMLYMENGDTLDLLPGIPRKWLDNGNEIILENMSSYFGPVSLTVSSGPGNHTIRATVSCDSGRGPGTVRIRIPHPTGKVPFRVTGGYYDRLHETVTLGSFRGEAEIYLEY